ncbi:hypothetical protein [Chitinophaga rhizophila]|uniref:Uncharacterized protein n=1 Tax=Chitinophaga rhizophila TaxID=2866212 RepID=A0ABS7GA39_9BACT|nr:hypothetical protein [Chitinophaga rhizophila]MBW8684306.1 hypothetical protein [Chitinophaga rhizophila]
MKPYALLITLFFSGLSATIAQERTRDKLFPQFKEDYAKMQQKEEKLKTTQRNTATRSTKEQLFTDYRPQNMTTRSSNLPKTNKPTGKNASDISSQEALKAHKARQPQLPAQVIVPDQGGETSGNAPVKSSSPVISPAKSNQGQPGTTAPANGAVNKSFQRKKQ